MRYRKGLGAKTLGLLLFFAAATGVAACQPSPNVGLLPAPTGRPPRVLVPAMVTPVPSPSPSPRPALTATPLPSPSPRPVPTATPTLRPTPTPAASTIPSLQAFVAQVVAAHPSPTAVAGLYLPGVLAARVVEQPPRQDAFVAMLPQTVTRFRLAARYYGTLGLLAHNSLAGAAFFHLETGDVFYGVRGDGRVRAYLVTRIVRYRALTPNSPYSAFIDLQTGERLTVTEAFARTYGAARGGVVLQTCIARQGQAAWGRLFVLARPLGPWTSIGQGGS